jgi:putative redox protein
LSFIRKHKTSRHFAKFIVEKRKKNMENPWREVIAEWKGEGTFIGRNTSGGTVQMGTIDGKPGVGPMELLLLGLAGCTGMDIAMILQKKRQPLADLHVRVRAKRAETYPLVYTDIEVTYLIWGDGLDTKAVEQAIQLSEEKYCSASAMLGAVARIRSIYQILSPEKHVK